MLNEMANKGENKPEFTKKKKPHKIFKQKKNKTQLTEEEIANLSENIKTLSDLVPEEIDSFKKFPISSKTLKGLKENKFTVPTKVQRETLIYSLQGKDVVATAKTGSGKTLAFMIPVLEELFHKKWSRTDGLGAIIITPTRELAYQIHELLKKVGVHHNFSSALVIGGKDWKYEKYSVGHCNILICTPGRLLHHITTYTDFDCSNVQALVLDEADMCLSMGFANDMNAILDELPKERKTYLFSATQTRDVKDLVRAGCNDPIFVSVHENSATSTPKSLKESYIVCEVEDKINFLWSFLKHHKRHKTLVFFSTCKQVRYMNSVFRQLRPGLSVLNIHGAMHQLRRMAVYDEFCRKQHAVLFATDVAARGLDIPSVDWVVQFDCPEDVTSYIHRAGRTARYSKPGETILLLTSSEEEPMVKKLQANNIPVEKIAADSRKLQSIQRSLETILVKHNHILQESQRAFKAYIKNVTLMNDKTVFNPMSINLDAYARSLGLEITPRVRFLERKIKSKNKSYKVDLKVENVDEEDEEDDFLVSNKDNSTIDMSKFESIEEDTEAMKKTTTKKKPVTKIQVAKKLLKQKLQLNTKIEFDEEGDALRDIYKEKIIEDSDLPKNQTIDIDRLKVAMKEEDKMDKKIHAEKQKERKRKEKAKLKEERQARKNVNNEENEEEYDEDSELDEDTAAIIDNLPDPDKYYGNSQSDNENDTNDDSNSENNDRFDKESSNEEESENDSDSSDEEENVKISGKRLAKQKSRDAKRARLAQSNEIDTLPVTEQEQLALYLLQNK